MIYAIIFIAGAIMGSFFYTLALRYAGGMFTGSAVRALFSRSQCPGCGVTPPALCMVPVLGWLFSAGRCRSCGMKISVMYPLWEILFGLLAVAVCYYMERITPSMHIFYLLHMHMYRYS